MRILIVSQYFWPEEFRINEVAASLVQSGAQVDVLSGKPNYPQGNIYSGYRTWGCQVQHHQGVSIYRVPLFPRGENSALRLGLNYLSFVAFGVLLAPWILRKRHYDVVFVYAPSPILQAIPAIFLAWRRRLKLVLWVQDLWPESLAATGHIKNSVVLNAIEWVVRWIYRHTDLLLVQSRAFEGAVRRLAPRKRVVYYPNSVDAGFAAAPSPKVPLPDVPGMDAGFSVVFAGNVGVGQAVEVIVEAAVLLRDCVDVHFVIFGLGSRWAWMAEQVKILNLKNLHLPGRFPVATMPGVMQKADALLVTLADEPIFALTVPNKVQAYMAAGRPILACLNGEGRRLVEDSGAGIGVPAQNAQALADAVLRLYRMPKEERDRMGVRGRLYYCANFDHGHLVNQLLGHLQVVTGTSGERV